MVHWCPARPLGEFEDRFFSTVFLGSGFLFLAMLFASAEKFLGKAKKASGSR